MKIAKGVEERIHEAMEDANAYIDKRAAEVAKTCPGVPVGVIRQTLTRGIGCACAAALQIAEDEERRNGRAA